MRYIVFSLVILSMAFFNFTFSSCAGCFTPVVPKPQPVSQRIDTDSHCYKFDNSNVYYFVCNNWVDSNGDGTSSCDEYVNVGKEIFRRGESITFVLSTRNIPVGSKISFVLFPPGYEKSKIKANLKTAFTNNVQPVQLAVGTDLLDKYGVGEYHVQWFINDNFVGRSDFKIIN